MIQTVLERFVGHMEHFAVADTRADVESWRCSCCEWARSGGACGRFCGFLSCLQRDLRTGGRASMKPAALCASHTPNNSRIKVAALAAQYFLRV
jgi:hypothetical protein